METSITERAPQRSISTAWAMSTVTVLLAITTALAAIAASRTDAQERLQATRGAAAAQMHQHVAQQSAAYNDARIVELEGVTRSRAAAELLLTAELPQRRVLARVKREWDRVVSSDAGREPITAEDALAAEYAPAVVAEQEAADHSRLAAEFSDVERSLLGALGVLVVALMLIGTSAVLPGRLGRRGFASVGVVLALFGGARVGVVATAAPQSRPRSALAAYSEGVVASLRGNVVGATVAFRRAVTIDPKFRTAWEALGDAYLTDAVARGTANDAVAAYENAVESTASARLYNNLAYAELLSGDALAAAQDIRLAVDRAPDDLHVRSTEAEVLAVLGDRDTALAAAESLILMFARESKALRNELASVWRQDARDLAAAGVATSLSEEYFGVLDRAAVTRDTFGDPYPRERGTADFVSVRWRYDADALRMNYRVELEGTVPEDHITVRVLDADGVRVVASDARAVDRNLGVGRLALEPGSYNVEVFLNGHRVHSRAATFRG